MYDFSESINDYFNIHYEILKKIDRKSISSVVNILCKTLETDSTIYILGNGGSSSTASHLKNDFNMIICKKQRFKVCCLSDNIATVTAIANDFSYEDIYIKQLEYSLKENDILIAISGSGNSKNIIKAVEYAKIKGNKIISMTGFNGGELLKLSDYNLHVPVNNMQISENMHLIFSHLLVILIMSVFENKNP